jgi:hypothetical protein
VALDETPTDVRLALVLRRLGAGGTITAASVDANVSRKTVLRWRSPGAWCVPGFAEACDRVTALASVAAPENRMEIERIVLAWTPSGGDDLFDGELAEDEQECWADADGAQPAPEPAESSFDGGLEPASPPPAEPDVLDTNGREIVASRPQRARLPAPPRTLAAHPTAEQLYPTRRAPTPEETLSMMADLATDPLQPASVRCAAIAYMAAAHKDQAAPRRSNTDPAVDPAVAEAASKQGRDPGVPASVWQEARQNFLGPAPDPDPASGATLGGDVVEFERAPPG